MDATTQDWWKAAHQYADKEYPGFWLILEDNALTENEDYATEPDDAPQTWVDKRWQDYMDFLTMPE